MSGTVLNILMPKEQPFCVRVSWHIKTKTTLVRYLREFKNERPSSITDERVNELEAQLKVREYPHDMWKWVKPRWFATGIDPKPDANGWLGGMIEQYEYDNHPENYFDHAAAREDVEESGQVIVRELKNPDGSTKKDENDNPIRINLFRRVCLLYSNTKKQGGGKVYDKFDKKYIKSFEQKESGANYETFFFHVLEADGKMRDVGYPGETEAPEIIPIASLYPRGSKIPGANWIYSSHVFGLKILLRQLVEKGQLEYKESLAHLEKHFRFDDKLGFYEFPNQDPTLDLSDEEVWINATKGIKRLKEEM